MQKIIGRNKELAELKRCMDSNRSEFVIVYGRRRVGKTFLVDSYFGSKYDFSFVGGYRLSKDKQLRSFAKAIKKAAKLETQPIFKDWTEAFDALEEYLESLPEDRKKVIFIDEMPWIDTPQSDFLESLEMFWNGWGARRDDIVFVATGSASSWMMDKIVENTGGLHARITNNIYVRPFTLHETEEYLIDRGFNVGKYQILQLYMIMGGVPFYLSLLDPKETIIANIDRLFFRTNGELRIEFDELYNAIFSKADKYLEIVNLLFRNKEGLTYDQISKKINLDGGRLSIVLRNLVRCDFVISYQQFGNKTKGSLYKLSDFYTLFYYKFIESNDSKDEQWWSRNFNSAAVESWQGTAFERVCLCHLPQIRQKLGISGISTSASSWRQVSNPKTDTKKGGQIDLVIERADRFINLCEIKFSISPYKITADYENKLRERMTIFKESTKTTASLQNTFITPFGVADGIHKGILDSEVVAEDLFVE